MATPKISRNQFGYWPIPDDVEIKDTGVCDGLSGHGGNQDEGNRDERGKVLAMRTMWTGRPGRPSDGRGA